MYLNFPQKSKPIDKHPKAHVHMAQNKMSDRRHKSDRPLNGELENKNFSEMFKKMYLNSEMADVHFLCAGFDGQTERIPAHKLLLSIASEGFKAMFSKSVTDQNEFNFEQIPAAAFKEFLQYVYMAKIKLTIDNIAAVMGLAKDYGNDDLLFLCGLFLEQRLTTENIIWGYSLALRFGRNKMKENCEKRISDCASEVFKSNSFLNCDRDVLNQILQLNTLKCDEFQVLTGCLSWAKASADRKSLDSKNTQILRDELGDLLYQIRFRSMTMDNFSMIVGSFGGFFSAEELEQIIQMIVAKDFTSNKFNSKLRGNAKLKNHSDQSNGDKSNPSGTIECNRHLTYTNAQYYIRTVEKARFILSNTLILTAFNCSLIKCQSDEKVNLPAKVTIVEGPTGESSNPTVLCTCETKLGSENETHIVLPTPLTIQKDCKYEIRLDLVALRDTFYNQVVLKKDLELKDGSKVRFLLEGNGYEDSKFGLVTKLFFKRAPTQGRSTSK